MIFFAAMGNNYRRKRKEKKKKQPSAAPCGGRISAQLESLSGGLDFLLEWIPPPPQLESRPRLFSVGSRSLICYLAIMCLEFVAMTTGFVDINCVIIFVIIVAMKAIYRKTS